MMGKVTDYRIVCLTHAKDNRTGRKTDTAYDGRRSTEPSGMPMPEAYDRANGEDGKQKICNDQNSKPDELEQDNQQ